MMKVKKRKKSKKRQVRKSNPSKGRKTMKVRRTKKSHKKRKVNPFNPKRTKGKRRYKRNPSMSGGIMGMLKTGAMAGAGAVVTATLGEMIFNKFVAGKDAAGNQTKKTITTILTSLAVGYAGKKFIKGNAGDAIAAGAIAAGVMKIVHSFIPTVPMGLAGASDADAVLDNLLGAAVDGAAVDGYDGELLLGMDDGLLLGDEDFDGEEEDQF